MRISERTIKALGEIITGDGGRSPYRSGADLVRFFNEFGANDRYPRGGGFPSRWDFAEQKIRQFNGTPTVEKIVVAAVDPKIFRDTDHAVEPAVEHINAYLIDEGFRLFKAGAAYRLGSSAGVHVQVDAPTESPDPISEEFIRQQIEKCDSKLAAGDFDGAVTNARALVEGVLREMEVRLSPGAASCKGDLVKQYGRVQKLLNLDPADKEIETPLRQVLSGLASVVSGLSGLRNVMSDAHARSYRPARHHAKLTVNAAKTVADFLFETFEYQATAGRLPTKASVVEGAGS